MMDWIVSNMGTIIVCIILVAAVGAILFNMLKKKQKGMPSCGGNCSGCLVKCEHYGEKEAGDH